MLFFYLEHVSGDPVLPSSAFAILLLVQYLCVGFWMLLWRFVGLWSFNAVSYTHLDVYKRQPSYRAYRVHYNRCVSFLLLQSITDILRCFNLSKMYRNFCYMQQLGYININRKKHEVDKYISTCQPLCLSKIPVFLFFLFMHMVVQNICILV